MLQESLLDVGFEPLAAGDDPAQVVGDITDRLTPVASATTVTVCALSAAQIWAVSVGAVRLKHREISVRTRV